MGFIKRSVKNKKGFTLVEIIISIAALGIICAVLLRLFVVAGSTNDTANSAQNAELFASTTVESIVCAETIAQGVESLGLQFASDITQYELNSGDYSAIVEIEDAGGDYPGTLYDVIVSVSEEDKSLSVIATKKYEQVSSND